MSLVVFDVALGRKFEIHLRIQRVRLIGIESVFTHAEDLVATLIQEIHIAHRMTMVVHEMRP